MITLEQAQAFIDTVGADLDIQLKPNKHLTLKLDCEPERDMSKAFDETYREMLQSVGVEADSYYGNVLSQTTKLKVQDRKRSAYVAFIPQDMDTFNVEIRYESSDEECDFIVNTIHVPACGVDEHLASIAKEANVLYFW